MKHNIKPTRRIPKRTYKDYASYKKWLREDFVYRCGYCSIHENEHGGYWHFHVEHYKPKGIPVFKHLETVYSNLLYSCDQCNSMKNDLWVSDDPIRDGAGWLDPCEHDLNEHYYYGYHNGEFTLICLTKVGKWMSSTLALNQPARIRKHRYLAEDQILDIQMLEALQTWLEKATRDNDLESIENYTKLLRSYEEKVKRKYAPEPFEILHRDKTKREVCP